MRRQNEELGDSSQSDANSDGEGDAQGGAEGNAQGGAGGNAQGGAEGDARDDGSDGSSSDSSDQSEYTVRIELYGTNECVDADRIHECPQAEVRSFSFPVSGERSSGLQSHFGR